MQDNDLPQIGTPMQTDETRAREVLGKIAPNCGVGMGGTCTRDEAVRAMLVFQSTVHSVTREEMARTVHAARFRNSTEVWPWEDEDANGKEYCYRIADAIMSMETAR